LVSGGKNDFEAGELAQLIDSKGRRYTVILQAGAVFGTHKGELGHDQIIGRDAGSMIIGTKGIEFLALRPTLADATTVMPRGAAIVYPKDAAQILMEGDIFPGARVLEAGVGSGALSCHLLRSVGAGGQLTSVDIRGEFAEVAKANVGRLLGEQPNWKVIVGDLSEVSSESFAARSFDRVVLDMLRPWQQLTEVARVIVLGGILTCYVTTVPQLSRTIEMLRSTGLWAELRAWETMVRDWHVSDLAVRPEHRMTAHSGFLITARRVTVAPKSAAAKDVEIAAEDLAAWGELPDLAEEISAKRLKKVISRAQGKNK